MRDVELAAQRIAHGVHSRAARVAKGNAGQVGGAQEVGGARLPGVLVLARNRAVAGQDEAQRGGREQFGQRRGVRAQEGLDCVDHGVD